MANRGYYTDVTNGSEKLSFGQYFGKSVKHVLQVYPKYIAWVKKYTTYYFSPKIEKEIKRLNIN